MCTSLISTPTVCQKQIQRCHHDVRGGRQFNRLCLPSIHHTQKLSIIIDDLKLDIFAKMASLSSYSHHLTCS